MGGGNHRPVGEALSEGTVDTGFIAGGRGKGVEAWECEGEEGEPKPEPGGKRG